MFLNFFAALRQDGVPVTLREYLDLTAALRLGLADLDVERFYFLARAILVKDERHLDRFDRVFGAVFRRSGAVGFGVPEPRDLPEDWLKLAASRLLSERDRRELASLDWDELMRTLRNRLAEQKERHEGGSKWIGTQGASPFGAHGRPRQGVRIGQAAGRGGGAVKVWDRRDYRDFDSSEELGPRNVKLALRRLRKFARDGSAEELDLDSTVQASARRAWLDVKMRPERKNAVKVLLFLDVGGSMDAHVAEAEKLFAAARAEFKRLEHFYFHNCLYEGAWKSNARRFVERTPTREIMRTFGRDYRVVFVGDASMSPFEITTPGGAVEYVNEEAGAVWMRRIAQNYPRCAWINPVPEKFWQGTESIGLMRDLMEGRMYPFTLAGLEAAMRALAH